MSENDNLIENNEDQEIIYARGCIPTPLEKLLAEPQIPVPRLLTPLAAKVDLSARFPAVGNQGQQNSCTAWALAYALKSHQEEVERNWGLGINDHLFSPAFVYNPIDQGENQGTDPWKVIKSIIDFGVCSLADMPYNQYNSSTQPNEKQKTAALKFKAFNRTFTDIGDVDAIKTYLAQGTPVVLNLNVCRNFNRLNRSNYIYNKRSGINEGWHAVCLVGYDDTLRAFKLLNSWGTGWGLNGYAYVAYDLLGDLDKTGHGYIMFDKIAVTGLKLNVSKATVYYKQTYQIGATIYPPTASVKTIKWTSSNMQVAAVNSSGTVTGAGVGKATITAVCEDQDNGWYQQTCEIEVVTPWKAEKIRESIPSTLVVNQKYRVSIEMKNTGLEPWSKADSVYLRYSLKNGTTTIINQRIQHFDEGEVIRPGQSKVFQFDLLPGSDTGEFVFSAHMYKSYGIEFAEFKKNVKIEPIKNQASLVTENIPTTMIAGQTYNIKICFKNTGNVSWTKSTYYQLNYNLKNSSYSIFTNKREYLGDNEIIKPGETKEFNFKITMPTYNGKFGNYTMEYSMIKHNTSESFGYYKKEMIYDPIKREVDLIKTHLPIQLINPQTYLVQFELKNSGNLPWTNLDSYELSTNYGQTDFMVFQAFTPIATAGNISPEATKIISFKVKRAIGDRELYIDHTRIYPAEYFSESGDHEAQTNAILNMAAEKVYDVYIRIKSGNSIWKTGKLFSFDLF